jgi:antitoxin ParD1/3/4
MVLQWTTKGDANMGVHKQSVSFTDAAFNFARELVESGEYPNISAAVSGEMARARTTRERERALFEAEVQRRLFLPLDAWEPIHTDKTLTSTARRHLAKLAKAGVGHTS